jgi:hypothetical protein
LTDRFGFNEQTECFENADGQRMGDFEALFRKSVLLAPVLESKVDVLVGKRSQLCCSVVIYIYIYTIGMSLNDFILARYGQQELPGLVVGPAE